jgi:putative ABC transport system ATP-binding protein
MTDVVLRAESLSKSYADGGVRAVDGIELTVRAGEFVNIMGSSGSGKTTLLYLLAGLEQPTDGSVWVDQNRIDQLGAKELAQLRRHSIGFVFQSMNLLPHLSLRENILVAGYLTARPRSEVQLTTDRLLEEMGIAAAAQRLPAEVSIGQQQRAAIGRALVNSPRMVFADEPTGSLNSSASAGVLDLLEAVNRAGTTVVMVTHDLKAACRGKRVLFIRDGRVEGQFDFESEHGVESGHGIGSEHRAAAEDREKRLCEWLFEKGW